MAKDEGISDILAVVLGAISGAANAPLGRQSDIGEIIERGRARREAKANQLEVAKLLKARGAEGTLPEITAALKAGFGGAMFGDLLSDENRATEREADRVERERVATDAAPALVEAGVYDNIPDAVAGQLAGTTGTLGNLAQEERRRTASEEIAAAENLGRGMKPLTPELAVSPTNVLAHGGGMERGTASLQRAEAAYDSLTNTLDEARGAEMTEEEFLSTVESAQAGFSNALGGLNNEDAAKFRNRADTFGRNQILAYKRDQGIQALTVGLAGYGNGGLRTVEELERATAQIPRIAQFTKEINEDIGRLGALLNERLDLSDASKEVQQAQLDIQKAGGVEALPLARIQELRRILPQISAAIAGSETTIARKLGDKAARDEAGVFASALLARAETGKGAVAPKDIEAFKRLADNPETTRADLQAGTARFISSLLDRGGPEDWDYLERVYPGDTMVQGAVRDRRARFAETASEGDRAADVGRAFEAAMPDVRKVVEEIQESVASLAEFQTFPPEGFGHESQVKQLAFVRERRERFSRRPTYRGIIEREFSKLPSGIRAMKDASVETEKAALRSEMAALSQTIKDMERIGEDTTEATLLFNEKDQQLKTLLDPSGVTRINLPQLGIDLYGAISLDEGDADKRVVASLNKLGIAQQILTVAIPESLGWDELDDYEREAHLANIYVAHLAQVVGSGTGSVIGADARAARELLGQLSMLRASLASSLPEGKATKGAISGVPKLTTTDTVDHRAALSAQFLVDGLRFGGR